jgi:hypothetical protein
MVLGLIKSCLGRKRLDCRVIQDDASARYPSVPQKWRKLVQYFTKPLRSSVFCQGLLEIYRTGVLQD